MVKKKIFKDPIHGYIEIDDDIVNNIIDSSLFQRLRRIEQTSMRVLYPAARHDRFIHSIGVYHLAQRVTNALRSSNKKDFESIEDIESILNSYEIASLLHDVGHSPFSHTLEDNFRAEKVDGVFKIEKLLKEALQKCVEESVFDVFKRDYKGQGAPHEIVSCIILLTQFERVISEMFIGRSQIADYDFMVRAIIGLPYAEKTVKNQIKNCLIKMLNSSSIDVDKLDYIVRDSTVAGFENIVIDMTRLLSSLTLKSYKNNSGQNEYMIVYNKTALSVIQGVVDARNSLYLWIYGHHKVKYETFLVQEAIKEIAVLEYKEKTSNFLYTTFSVENIVENLLCDDDIWCLIRKYKEESCFAKELMNRRLHYNSVWKSIAEFRGLFPENDKVIKLGDFSKENMISIAGAGETSENYLKFVDYLKEYENKNIDFRIIKANIKFSTIQHNSIWVAVDDVIYGYDVLLGDLSNSFSPSPYFYIYYPKEIELNKVDFIAYLKKYQGFKLMP